MTPSQFANNFPHLQAYVTMQPTLTNISTGGTYLGLTLCKFDYNDNRTYSTYLNLNNTPTNAVGFWCSGVAFIKQIPT